jgi:hypothetical protein
MSAAKAESEATARVRRVMRVFTVLSVESKAHSLNSSGAI